MVTPADWKRVSLRDIADVRTGPFGSALHASDYVSSGTPIITVEHLGEFRLLGDAAPKVGGRDRDRLVMYSLEQGDIVFSRVGSIGRFGLVTEAETGWLFSGRLLRVRLRAGCSRFMFHQMRSTEFIRQVESVAVGQTMPSLNTVIVGDLSLTFPPLKEQEAVAEVLSDADAAIEALDALIAKKRDVKQAAIQQLLTGRTRLPGFSEERQSARLGDIARVKTGSRNNQDKVPDGRYPFYVRSAHVESIDSFSYDGEAILIPGEGGIGEIFHYVNGPHEVHQRVYRVSDFGPDVCPKFVFFHLRSYFGPHAMRNTVKATVDSLRLPTFLEFKLLLPPLSEQKAIAAVLSDIDLELEALVAERDKMRLVKQGMMQDLLSGRVRLL